MSFYFYYNRLINKLSSVSQAAIQYHSCILGDADSSLSPTERRTLEIWISSWSRSCFTTSTISVGAYRKVYCSQRIAFQRQYVKWSPRQYGVRKLGVVTVDHEKIYWLSVGESLFKQTIKQDSSLVMIGKPQMHVQAGYLIINVFNSSYFQMHNDEWL